MVKAFVKIGADGYVNEWVAPRLEDGYMLIESDDSLVTNIDCVKIVNGVAVLDKEKQEELQEENKEMIEMLEREKAMYEDNAE
ncbi:hypothetical protein [Listeria booriae]|uniref:Uncharacterized protein n=1 Tax=Listeria booriae TaxID=1552123 RepID=A0A842EPA3_9LIST|nr:hypothetical protein [Listeria booriae]MBC1231482.1 hypothetical protein [Listeria booriae]MBC1801132.1 hypothetical protein [Listeria booriae]MBC2239747.1 hypothetical protein [Listeria booriae]